MDSAKLDAPMNLTIVRWEGAIRCVYLNNFRIAGGKPWGGGDSVKEFKGITIRELARAIPALREELGLDYLGKPVPAAHKEVGLGNDGDKARGETDDG